MGKIEITMEDRKGFRASLNGIRKKRWKKVGVMLDILSTLAIALLTVFASKLPNQMYYYIILYVLLVIVVIGGELIGSYFGALEQYVIDKKSKKQLDFVDE